MTLESNPHQVWVGQQRDAKKYLAERRINFYIQRKLGLALWKLAAVEQKNKNKIANPLLRASFNEKESITFTLNTKHLILWLHEAYQTCLSLILPTQYESYKNL